MNDFQLSFQLEKLPSYFVNSSSFSRGIAENYRFIKEQRHFWLVTGECTSDLYLRNLQQGDQRTRKKLRASIGVEQRFFGVIAAAESQEAPAH